MKVEQQRGDLLNTSGLESLLQRLLDKQDRLIDRLESLVSTVADYLQEVICWILEPKSWGEQIHDELNWWEKDTPWQSSY